MYRKQTAFAFFLCIFFLTDTSQKNVNATKKTTTAKKRTDSKAVALERDKDTSAKKASPSRTIRIKNAISPEMIRYRFWGTYYTPTQFYLTIQNKKLSANETVEYALSNNTNAVEVTYHYEFQNGIVTGSKSVEFEIPSDKGAIEITFSWKDNHRLICNTGKVIRSSKSIMKSSCSFI